MEEEDLKKIEILLESKFSTYIKHLTHIFYRLESIEKRIGNLEFDLKPIDTTILTQPIEAFNLSIRTLHILQALNCKTLRDLCVLTESDLIKARGCGRHVLGEIKQFLSSHFLRLGMTSNS